MVPRKEESLPDNVKLAYDIVTRLGDYSNMPESDDMLANIKALANILVTVGTNTMFYLCFLQGELIVFLQALYISLACLFVAISFLFR
jgi:hypothetical protein